MQVENMTPSSSHIPTIGNRIANFLNMPDLIFIQDFVKSLLKRDPLANIIVAGDYNEFSQTRAVFGALDGLLVEADVVAGVPPVERYTYLFDQNSQQLDHALISPAIKDRKVEFEHIHVNTWSPTLAARISDHDPSVGRIRLC